MGGELKTVGDVKKVYSMRVLPVYDKNAITYVEREATSNRSYSLPLIRLRYGNAELGDRKTLKALGIAKDGIMQASGGVVAQTEEELPFNIMVSTTDGT